MSTTAKKGGKKSTAAKKTTSEPPKVLAKPVAVKEPEPCRGDLCDYDLQEEDDEVEEVIKPAPKRASIPEPSTSRVASVGAPSSASSLKAETAASTPAPESPRRGLVKASPRRMDTVASPRKQERRDTRSPRRIDSDVIDYNRLLKTEDVDENTPLFQGEDLFALNFRDYADIRPIDVLDWFAASGFRLMTRRIDNMIVDVKTVDDDSPDPEGEEYYEEIVDIEGIREAFELFEVIDGVLVIDPKVNILVASIEDNDAENDQALVRRREDDKVFAQVFPVLSTTGRGGKIGFVQALEEPWCVTTTDLHNYLKDYAAGHLRMVYKLMP